jgi:hypothetical protein
VAEEVKMNVVSVKAVIYNELKFNRVTATCFPKQLLNEQVEKHVELCIQLH